MGKRFNQCDPFYNQKVTFNYEDKEMTWSGDYEINRSGEESDWDYPGDSETTIIITNTDNIEMWSEELEDWVHIAPTPSILAELEFAIEKSI